MTTHEYDAYCDAVALEPQDDSLLLAEMERDHIEMKEAHEAALLRRGAKEALETLKSELQITIIAAHNVGRESLLDGLFCAKEKVEKALVEVELTPEVGGEFPPNYFAEMGGAA